MKKELFKIFGPLICAFLLLGIFLGLPLFNRGKISKEKMREISYSQSTNIFKGRYVKNQAFSGKYVPFFGSSELSRLDALHPSILAEKYHRNYQPFFAWKCRVAITCAFLFDAAGQFGFARQKKPCSSFRRNGS